MAKSRRSTKNKLSRKRFGGTWTEKKLAALVAYVEAYLVIMNRYSFETIYFDGFAGSGERVVADSSEDAQESHLEIGHEYFQIPPAFPGSPRRILTIPENSFDYYYFIDTNEENCRDLKTLAVEYPEKKIVIRNSACSEQLRKLSDALREDANLRAVVFLDPFGMQIDWDDLELLRGTQTDLWVLVPTGHPIPKFFQRDGQVTGVEKLCKFFGVTEDALLEHFSTLVTSNTLFGDHDRIENVGIAGKAAALYSKRLGELYSFVATPVPLYNDSGLIAFHLLFASQNKTGKKIAEDLLKKIKRT